MADQIDKLKTQQEAEKVEEEAKESGRFAGSGPSSGADKVDASVVQYLRQKIYHFEKTVQKLEKERSELQVRAVMAEEQLKVLQTHLQQQTLSQVRKIQEL